LPLIILILQYFHWLLSFLFSLMPLLITSQWYIDDIDSWPYCQLHWFSLIYGYQIFRHTQITLLAISSVIVLLSLPLSLAIAISILSSPLIISRPIVITPSGQPHRSWLRSMPLFTMPQMLLITLLSPEYCYDSHIRDFPAITWYFSLLCYVINNIIGHCFPPFDTLTLLIATLILAGITLITAGLLSLFHYWHYFATLALLISFRHYIFRRHGFRQYAYWCCHTLY